MLHISKIFIKWVSPFNEAMGKNSAPCIHKFGIRVDNKTSQDEYGNIRVLHKVNHKWEQWREVERDRMLHLADSKRIDLGGSVNKYFQFNT